MDKNLLKLEAIKRFEFLEKQRVSIDRIKQDDVTYLAKMIIEYVPKDEDRDEYLKITSITCLDILDQQAQNEQVCQPLTEAIKQKIAEIQKDAERKEQDYASQVKVIQNSFIESIQDAFQQSQNWADTAADLIVQASCTLPPEEMLAACENVKAVFKKKAINQSIERTIMLKYGVELFMRQKIVCDMTRFMLEYGYPEPTMLKLKDYDNPKKTILLSEDSMVEEAKRRYMNARVNSFDYDTECYLEIEDLADIFIANTDIDSSREDKLVEILLTQYLVIPPKDPGWDDTGKAYALRCIEITKNVVFRESLKQKYGYKVANTAFSLMQAPFHWGKDNMIDILIDSTIQGAERIYAGTKWTVEHLWNFAKFVGKWGGIALKGGLSAVWNAAKLLLTIVNHSLGFIARLTPLFMTFFKGKIQQLKMEVDFGATVAKDTIDVTKAAGGLLAAGASGLISTVFKGGAKAIITGGGAIASACGPPGVIVGGLIALGGAGYGIYKAYTAVKKGAQELEETAGKAANVAWSIHKRITEYDPWVWLARFAQYATSKVVDWWYNYGEDLVVYGLNLWGTFLDYAQNEAAKLLYNLKKKPKELQHAFYLAAKKQQLAWYEKYGDKHSVEVLKQEIENLEEGFQKDMTDEEYAELIRKENRNAQYFAKHPELKRMPGGLNQDYVDLEGMGDSDDKEVQRMHTLVEQGYEEVMTPEQVEDIKNSNTAFEQLMGFDKDKNAKKEYDQAADAYAKEWMKQHHEDDWFKLTPRQKAEKALDRLSKYKNYHEQHKNDPGYVQNRFFASPYEEGRAAFQSQVFDARQQEQQTEDNAKAKNEADKELYRETFEMLCENIGVTKEQVPILKNFLKKSAEETMEGRKNKPLYEDGPVPHTNWMNEKNAAADAHNKEIRINMPKLQKEIKEIQDNKRLSDEDKKKRIAEKRQAFINKYGLFQPQFTNAQDYLEWETLSKQKPTDEQKKIPWVPNKKQSEIEKLTSDAKETIHKEGVEDLITPEQQAGLARTHISITQAVNDFKGGKKTDIATEVIGLPAFDSWLDIFKRKQQTVDPLKKFTGVSGDIGVGETDVGMEYRPERFDIEVGKIPRSVDNSHRPPTKSIYDINKENEEKKNKNKKPEPPTETIAEQQEEEKKEKLKFNTDAPEKKEKRHTLVQPLTSVANLFKSGFNKVADGVNYALETFYNDEPPDNNKADELNEMRTLIQAPLVHKDAEQLNPNKKKQQVFMEVPKPSQKKKKETTVPTRKKFLVYDKEEAEATNGQGFKFVMVDKDKNMEVSFPVGLSPRILETLQTKNPDSKGGYLKRYKQRTQIVKVETNMFMKVHMMSQTLHGVSKEMMLHGLQWGWTLRLETKLNTSTLVVVMYNEEKKF